MKLKRVLRWMLSNAALGLLVWLAVNNVTGAGRLLSFVTWFFAVLIFLIAANNEAKEKLRLRGRSLPAWLSHGVGYTMVFVLVWHGWGFTAFALVICELSEAAIYDGGENGKETA
ncbi:hypothetical protein OKA05_01940 [Luteolibacter arcticus]|uniref:Uncharacterized protein n=1 Tax=Luteolibacter arcticus TaxID=1581411 RepID=A0ABT3GCD9_9BACT|nr:hypothetical protein [Luteolibacter arcticus]MCW1921293.1 hypothetical protein [Luteolibacter arcticus]